MDALLWFAAWAVLFFVMMRFGCGAHVMGHAHKHGAGTDAAAGRDSMRWAARATAIDPVCHMTANTNSAKSAVHGGTVYDFCSNECRDRFEVSPERDVGADANREPTAMEHSHD